MAIFIRLLPLARSHTLPLEYAHRRRERLTTSLDTLDTTAAAAVVVLSPIVVFVSIDYNELLVHVCLRAIPLQR